MIALGKRQSQMRAGGAAGRVAAFDVDEIENPVELVRAVDRRRARRGRRDRSRGAPQTWEWALQMVRKGGTVNLFGGCPQGTRSEFRSGALHYSEITIKSTFHHTPRFMREALDTIARGEIRASDFITGEVAARRNCRSVFEHMKHRNGELKTAVIP